VWDDEETVNNNKIIREKGEEDERGKRKGQGLPHFAKTTKSSPNVGGDGLLVGKNGLGDDFGS